MYRPFENLQDLVREGRLTFGDGAVAGTRDAAAGPARAITGAIVIDAPSSDLSPELSDDDLFSDAMKDVKALGWSAAPLHHRPPMELEPQDDEADALRALADFVRHGNVEIEHTAEYIEGFSIPEGRLYLDDLRSGRFSIQAYLDLHGMNQQAARFALDEFVLASIRSGYRCVRVIHGRGRHSHKHLSILKESIQRWLCGRRMSRHVIAYTSARMVDGGGGAVYVLLRRR